MSGPERQRLLTLVSALSLCEKHLKKPPSQLDCTGRALLQLASWPHHAQLLDRLYNAPRGERFRLPACDEKSRHARGHGDYSGDLIWHRKAGAVGECLWSNMPLSKRAAIISLALALNVSHIVESGRMGGLGLLDYLHFGFAVTSVERYPVPHVRRSLRRIASSIELMDGDGMELVPRAVQQILGHNPAARVAIVIDGPKGELARTLARQLRNQTVFLALDDQFVSAAEWGGPAFSTRADELWPGAAFPRANDMAHVSSWDALFYHRTTEVCSVLLADRWRPARDLRPFSPSEIIRHGEALGLGMSSSSNSLPWRPHQHVGFCETTEDDPGDCDQGNSGSFRLELANEQRRSRPSCASLRRCTEACRACARCAFVSVSDHNNECGWFASCDVAKLRTGENACRYPGCHANTYLTVEVDKAGPRWLDCEA